MKATVASLVEQEREKAEMAARELHKRRQDELLANNQKKKGALLMSFGGLPAAAVGGQHTASVAPNAAPPEPLTERDLMNLASAQVERAIQREKR